MSTKWALIDALEHEPQGPTNSVQRKISSNQISGSANHTYVVAATSADDDRLALNATMDAGFGGSMLHGNPANISKNAYILEGYLVPFYGPSAVITILDGARVTVGDGAVLKVLNWDDL